MSLTCKLERGVRCSNPAILCPKARHFSASPGALPYSIGKLPRSLIRRLKLLPLALQSMYVIHKIALDGLRGGCAHVT